MKCLLTGLLAAVLLSSGSGCCCFWDNVHQMTRYHCGGSTCSHYLDPHGAQYGAYCGTCCDCCAQSGCGDMYWGDYWSVRPTHDPCDCCGNWIGHPFRCDGCGQQSPAGSYQGPLPGPPVPAVMGHHVEGPGVVHATPSIMYESEPMASRPMHRKSSHSPNRFR
jgi:hypothetical protein